ncbi:hypothetical protein [Microbacterium sp. SORGH_AS_0862]|uniref:hypothetical protein n=1 Tax=Microbacterium sp. SORGH_AS_0862 TaxID=3041789 RepID=UPI0027916248|nr:hypothetical protein [Microbacterium sp. SORGH_AS_0862]MDQ1205227.1 hypothetical protein [Microbacterium sp. SORGH_AS_0862]
MRVMNSGRARAVLAVGMLAAGGALATAAAFTDHADVRIDLDGSLNRFDIVTAGGVGLDPQTWSPETAGWQQGNPDAVPLGAGDDEGILISPGGSVRAVIAVKNDSPRLNAAISLTVQDPTPRGSATDPATGRYLELFDQLVFTVREVDGPVLLDHVAAPELTPHVLPQVFATGEWKKLEVTIDLPDSVDNRWQGATTDVLFSFHAVQS